MFLGITKPSSRTSASIGFETSSPILLCNSINLPCICKINDLLEHVALVPVCLQETLVPWLFKLQFEFSDYKYHFAEQEQGFAALQGCHNRYMKVPLRQVLGSQQILVLKDFQKHLAIPIIPHVTNRNVHDICERISSQLHYSPTGISKNMFAYIGLANPCIIAFNLLDTRYITSGL